MNTAIEETGRPQAAAEKPKAKKQARVGAQGAHVAPKKVKAPKKATAARKRLRPNQKEAGVARGGSKATKILELLKQADGATLAEIMKTTDWQAHSVRGFLSTAGKKHKLKIESTRTGGERTYKIAK